MDYLFCWNNGIFNFRNNKLNKKQQIEAPEEGDIYIVNDPYMGGTHLMDVRFAKPFF